MRNHVARLLKQSSKPRKMLSITLDTEQVELAEKLALFFSRETNHNFTRNQIIEESVRAFVSESVEFIAEEFDMDIRNTTLTEMQQYKRICAVDVSALDTVVLPVRDDDHCRELLFRSRRWNPVQLDNEKLLNLKYAAFCFGNPTSAITHYARIRSFAPAPGDPRKKILHFELPETLGQRLEWQEPAASRLRRPRYTALAILMEAKTIDELFGQ